MKLLRAAFQNFRLLRNLELEFSTEPEQKLTVIRAANETGKTTILNGLQWALYGDMALPGKGEGFRLHPIDWDVNDGRRVPITATVEFEVTSYRRAPAGLRETRRQYRIVRSAFEEVDGTNWRRSPATVKLFALKDAGADPIDAPEALINDELPPELRDVFFTDGDRALSFIEADVALSTKRERVQRAIRSLLGLGVLDDAIKHVRKASSEVNKQAKRIASSGELTAIASRLEAIEEDTARLESELEDAKEQFAAFDENVNDVDKKIAAALQKGDREELQRELEQARRKIKQLDEQLAAANKEHSALFRGRHLATDLLAPVLARAYGKLEELHDQGKIPNTTIPVLEDRLDAQLCICGESLAPEKPDGQRRRRHIEKLINDSRRADEVQEIITDLYYGAKTLQTRDERAWLQDYEKVVKSRDGLQSLRDDAGRELKAIELRIDALPDTNVQGLRETKRQYLNQRDRFLKKRTEIETQLEGLGRERERLTAERDRLLREQKRGARILSELEVTQDVIQVLQSSYERITNEELAKVSALMNLIFLEMIGADPEQGAIIKRAEISPEFDIIVYGPNDRTLNPDRDLNGASRRALTLAFILALTKISEVEAPNVIDTPLGMTSGYVKRSILRTAIRESAQLILFLTHDEIAGCEDILDESAGVVFTLTNPAHYPKMLVNDSGTNERKVLRCDCDHRSVCALCERRRDAEIQLQMAS
jgi:DNA sulfur modification protein DndD